VVTCHNLYRPGPFNSKKVLLSTNVSFNSRYLNFPETKKAGDTSTISLVYSEIGQPPYVGVAFMIMGLLSDALDTSYPLVEGQNFGWEPRSYLQVSKLKKAWAFNVNHAF
jgi:hypothetical protein